jgi:ubiquinol-cytochrome c reductase cytochrome c subunit
MRKADSMTARSRLAAWGLAALIGLALTSCAHGRVPANVHLDEGTIADGGAGRQSSTDKFANGARLYDVHCSSCHGVDLGGMPGVPSLRTSGGAVIDFYMTTGRMPLAVKANNLGPGRSDDQIMASGVQAPHAPSPFTAAQNAALISYVNTHARTLYAVPQVALDAKAVTHGRELYEENCQACHGAGAQGETAGYQWSAPNLDQATPTQIGEAIRIGPGVMPRFTRAQLSDADLSAIASYVTDLARKPQNYGGWNLGSVGPVAEGAVGAAVGVGLIFWVVYFSGTKAKLKRKD